MGGRTNERPAQRPRLRCGCHCWPPVGWHWRCTYRWRCCTCPCCPAGPGRPGWAVHGLALDLAPASGGFVETVFTQPGTYPFLTHAMADADRGARGAVHVTS